MPQRLPQPWRLFLAIHPPSDVAAQMCGVNDLIDPCFGCRPTPVEQVHLTLQFIGDTPQSRMETVIESIARAASGIGPVHLQPQRLRILPDRGPARVLAIEANQTPALLELKRRLASRLAQRRQKHRDAASAFLPHFTIARFKPPSSEINREQIDAITINAELAFTANAITLMRSTLKPGGSEHASVQTFTRA
ncbi:MAG: RNA 2',3'-cyclic phosphodiesterase [Phycisphaerales bacterium]